MYWILEASGMTISPHADRGRKAARSRHLIIERLNERDGRKMSHEQYVHSIRQQIVDTAKAMLAGDLSYLLGSRKLAALRHEAAVKRLQ